MVVQGLATIGTLYLSGIAAEEEEELRLWLSLRSEPNKTIASVARGAIMAYSWVWHITGGDKQRTDYVIEVLRSVAKDDPKFRAALGENLPADGRLPSLIEVMRWFINRRIEPLYASDMKNLETARKGRLARIAEYGRRVLEATDEESEEKED